VAGGEAARHHATHLFPLAVGAKDFCNYSAHLSLRAAQRRSNLQCAHWGLLRELRSQ